MSQSCKKKPCGCEDTGLTTPSPCVHDTPQCPDPDPCCEIFDAQCIQYNGDGNECLGVTTGQRLNEVLDIIMTELATLKCVSCPVISIPSSGATDVAVLPTLIWGASPGATMYDVYFGTDPSSLALISIGQSTTSYTFVTPNELTVGTTYYWSVTARNTTGSSGTCSPFSFTTVGANCTNPLTVLLDAAKLLVTEENDLADAVETILTNGFTTSSCDVCCPDCTETQRYFLGGIDAWIAYSNLVYNAQTCPPPCCVNKNLSVTNLITFSTNNNTIGTPPGGCCDDFTTCLKSLLNYLGGGASEFIEESSFKDSSGFCTILPWFQANSTPQDATAVMFNILLLGMVIHCLSDGTIIIASVSTYNSWYTATSQTCYTSIQ